MKHGKPNFECKCGKEFPTKKQRDIHAFNMEAQEFIENNFGNPFADYHRSIMRDMGGIASYTAAKEEDIPTELTEENVKQAALAFCQGALVAPNSDMLLEYTELAYKYTLLVTLAHTRVIALTMNIKITIEGVDDADLERVNSEMKGDVQSDLDESLYRKFSEDWNIDFEDISVEFE